MLLYANGTKMVKYDGTNAYQVGIAAPSAGSAAAAAGGSLAAGVYQIYIGYARQGQRIKCSIR